MKKIMDKLKKQIKINPNLLVFLTVLVLVAVASGALFSSLLSDSDKTLVSKYINEFLKGLTKGNIVNDKNIINNLTFTLASTIFIWIFGISIIGIILILPFLFIKSFILGFTIGSIITNLKIKGIIIVFIYIMPHHIINILIYILISSYAITVSYKLINSIKNKKTLDFKKIMNKYTFILIFTLITLILSVLYETYIVPHIIKFALNILK